MLDVVTLQDLWKDSIDGYFPCLLEIYNPDICWNEEERLAYNQSNGYLRLISDENQVKYKGKTWLPCGFDFTRPELDGKKIGNASITITAFDVRVRKILRLIELPSDITVVAMFAKKEIASDEFVYKFVEINGATFQMKVANSTQTTVTFNLEFDGALSQSVPYDIATPDRVPAAVSES